MNRFLIVFKVYLVVFLFSSFVVGESVKILGRSYDINNTIELDISWETLSDIEEQLTEIPMEVFDLINLRRLDISGHLLKELPVNIAKLLDLEFLDISNNQIKKMPESLSNLVFLQEINFSHNRMKEFPVALSRLPKIKKIECTNNSFTCFLVKNRVTSDNLDINLIEEKEDNNVRIGEDDHFVDKRYFYSSILIKTSPKTVEKWREDFLSLVIEGGWLSPCEPWVRGGPKTININRKSKRQKQQRSLAKALNTNRNREDIGQLIIINKDPDAPPINMVIYLSEKKKAALLGLVFKEGDFRYTAPNFSLVRRTHANNSNLDLELP